jgi:hypothetical protein
MPALLFLLFVRANDEAPKLSPANKLRKLILSNDWRRCCLICPIICGRLVKFEESGRYWNELARGDSVKCDGKWFVGDNALVISMRYPKYPGYQRCEVYQYDPLAKIFVSLPVDSGFRVPPHLIVPKEFDYKIIGRYESEKRWRRLPANPALQQTADSVGCGIGFIAASARDEEPTFFGPKAPRSWTGPVPASAKDEEATDEIIIQKACHLDSTVVFDTPITIDWSALAQAVFSGVDFDKLDLAGVKEFMRDPRGFKGRNREIERFFEISYLTPVDEALQKLNYYLISAQGIYEFHPAVLHGKIGFDLNNTDGGFARIWHWDKFVTPVDLVKGEVSAKFVLISKKKLARPQQIKVRRIKPDSSGAAPSFCALKTGDRLAFLYRFENGAAIKLESTGYGPGPLKLYKPRAAIELRLEGENFKWLYVVWGSEFEEIWEPCTFAMLFG